MRNRGEMTGLELVLTLLAVSILLRLLAERWRIPYATLLVLGGLALASIPGLPRIDLAPDTLFLIFVPPLLYWGASMFPLRDLRRESGPILRLAILMVLVSTAATAAVVHAIDPVFTWAAAFTLGAIIAPPDPVAVLSIMKWVRLPRQIERILEGEGLLNDATALVTYRLAVAAAVTGVFSPVKAVVEIVFVSAGGVIVGLAVGRLVTRLRQVTREVNVADISVLLLLPFASYLAAEVLAVSGVVSVVTTAMYVSRSVQNVGTPAMRLQGYNVWTMVTFLLESLIFILTGLELPYIMRDLEVTNVGSVLREAGIVYLCLVVVRLLWVFPSAYVGRAIGRRLQGTRDPYPSWQQVAFVGWSGVRGGDSVVIALALPITTAAGHAFPARSRIIFITFCVVLATLVIQAPTLRALARFLGFRYDASDENEEAHARLKSAEAGLEALDAVTAERSGFPEVARYLKQRHRQRARRWSALEARLFGGRGDGTHDQAAPSPPSHEGGELDERRAAEYRRIRTAMLHAERRALLALRDREQIGDDVMRRLERELDLEQLLLEGSAPVIEAPREVVMPGG